MNARTDAARKRATNASPEPIDIVVTDPQGLRAKVDYPPFSSAAPLLNSSVVEMGSAGEGRKAIQLNIGCCAHPEAAEFIRSVGPMGRLYTVSISMRAHPSGNGYVVLRVSQGRDSAAPSGPALETALDPVEHRPVIDALRESGLAIIVVDARPGQAASGLVLQLDQDSLDRAYAAALSHPRRIRFG